jgi:general secretion pathway protein D
MSPGAAQMANALAGQVLVVADPNTNSLLVTTASRFEAQVRQIIAELDRSVPQVLIKVLVAEVTHDNSVDFGTDFSVLNTRPNGNGQSAGQTFGTPGTGLVVNFLENNLNAQLHALAQQNKLDVLSRPYILASDNQPASILVGQQVPIVNSNYTTALGQTVSNYTYESVGIILNVTPHINPDGLVTLDVAPEISQLTAQTVSVGPGVNAPIIADRSATSRVGIRDGNTIVIGGLMQDQKTLTVNKIPLLGDIPLIGSLFSRTQLDKTKTELLIFLTPHVAQQPEALGSMSQDEMNGTKLTPNAVSPGMMQEHLQGMQRGSRSQTQPATQPLPSVLEFKAGTEAPNQTPTQTIPLPIR